MSGEAAEERAEVCEEGDDYIRAFDKGIAHLFGPTATRMIYDYLERKHGIKKGDIPMKKDEIQNILKELLGKATAAVVEKNSASTH